MFNGSYREPSAHGRTTGQEPSSSVSRVETTTGDLPPSALEFQYGFSHPDLQYQKISQAPDVASNRLGIQSTFPHPIPVLQGNSNSEPGPYNMPATSNPWERGGDAPTYYGRPTPVTPTVHIDQTETAGATFTSGAEHPPNQTPYNPRVQPPSPQVYAMPNAQGIPTPIWQLFQTWIDYEGGDDLRLTILFKKVRST